MPFDVAALPSPLRIAIVDDDHWVRSTLVALLDDVGARVLDFPSGTEAAAALADARAVDVVLTDVNMPGMDGVALAEALWTRRADLPVIFMSGRSPPDRAHVFLAKPFSLNALLATVSEVVSGRIGRRGLTAPLILDTDRWQAPATGLNSATAAWLERQTGSCPCHFCLSPPQRPHCSACSTSR